MLGPYGETLVVDWGLAKALGRRDAAAGPAESTWLPAPTTDSGLTQQGAVAGTPEYMSPEQAAGKLPELGPATDIYSLGATLYCLLTGKPPIHDADPLLTLMRVQLGEFPPPRQVKPQVSAALEAICLKALAMQPAERYPTARELARDVEHWLADEPVAAHRERWWQRAARWARHHQAAMAAGTAAVLVALLLGGAGALAWQREQARREAEQARQAEQQRQTVQATLSEVLRLRSQGRWDSGRTLLRHAEEQLGEQAPQELRDQLAQARRQLELVARLDDIRLQAATIVEGKLDTAGADREYATVFAETGLGTEGESAEVVAQRIRDSGIAGELVATLDAWSVFAVQASRARWVLAIARQVDPDPVWRDRARDPAVRSDRAALERLAAEAMAPDQSPQLVLSVSQSLVLTGGDARGLLRQAWQRHPDDFWLAFQLGNVLHWQGEHGEAAGYYRAALALRPSTAVVHSNLGMMLDAQGKWEEAIQELRLAIQLDPKYATPQYTLGKVLWQQAKHEEADQELRLAIQLDPKSGYPHNCLGNVLHDRGKEEEAFQEYRRAIQLDPKNALPHNGLGTVLREQGKREEAIQEYRLAIQLDPKFAGFHYNLGNVLREQGKREEAIQEYRLGIQLDPKSASFHYNLGNVLREQGKQEEAIAEYRLAIQLDPKSALLHNGLGMVLDAQGKREEAIAEYRLAIQLDPKSPLPHNGLGIVLYAQGKPEEAIAEYGLAIQLDPKFALAHNNLGEVLRTQGKPEEAIREFRLAIQLDPKSAQPHNGLGNVLGQQGKLEEAIQEFRRTIQLNPKVAPPHNGLGVVLWEQGKHEEALQEFRLAIQLDPKDALPRSNLGFRLAATGQFDEAIQQFQQAASLGVVGATEQARRCERLRDLKRRLPAVLDGKDRPADVQEMLAFADLCYQPYLKRYAAAARFWTDAFTADAKLADDWKAAHRYNAACCAALAGCGQGNDAARQGDKEKARLRQQALDWLKTDLVHWSSLAQSSKADDRTLVRQTLQHWQEDSDLAGVRGDALAKLPQTERDAWKKLWADVEAVLARTR
jgi:Flp pilus assembly protein TadD